MSTTVRDNPAEHRYEILVDDQVAGVSHYELDAGQIEFTHTEVGDAHQGQGVGKQLVTGNVMLVLRYYLQLAPALAEHEVWERAPAEKDRRATLILDGARKLEALLPRTVRRGWIHWRWPEVASAVSTLSGYIQGTLVLSSDASSKLPRAIEAVADPLVERDGTSRLFWRRRRTLLQKAKTAATALGTDEVDSLR